MSKVNYICFLGRARTGKTTLAEMVAKMLTAAGHKVEIHPLADTLKKLCPPLPGESKEQWRPRLLEVGNNNRQRYGQGYLATKIIMKVGDFRDDIEGGFIIVPDVRIAEEYNAFRDAHNALTPTLFLRTHCNDGTWGARFGTPDEFTAYANKAATDITESGLPLLDAIEIDNNADGKGKLALLRLIYDRYINEEVKGE